MSSDPALSPAPGIPLTADASDAKPRRPFPFRNLIFLCATFYTMTVAGAAASGEFASPGAFDPSRLAGGLSYSLCLIAILGAHEMGHYIACRLYGVDASLPWFLPAPPPLGFIGTFGAFIRIRGPIPDRRALFDIGVAGPIAGFLVALPILMFGLLAPTLVTGEATGSSVGEPLLMSWLGGWMHAQPEGSTILLCGPVMAAWVGCLATAMNLFPIGQLDGGHVCYAISPRFHRAVSRLMLGALVMLGLLVFPGWLFLALLIVTFGPRHPPVMDEGPPLGRARLLVALAALLIFILCFIPMPLDLEGL
jgi:membrane-associated protease RseP (regulator of RpoE activity)